MHDITRLIEELDNRMKRDCRWLMRWRHFHRIVAIMINLTLIAAPSILAVGLTTSETILGKTLLLSIAILGGLSATFKPYTHSYKRRADMNSIYRLRDEFRGEAAKVATTDSLLVEVYQRYSYIYSNIYELRGKELIEATLGVSEQREVAQWVVTEAPEAARPPA
jgi:hypothetical protein